MREWEKKGRGENKKECRRERGGVREKRKEEKNEKEKQQNKEREQT